MLTTLVTAFGSSRRACSCAATDASSRPQYRHAWHNPAKMSGSAATCGLLEQAHHRFGGAAAVHFHLRKDVVRDGEIRIERECAVERIFRAHTIGDLIFILVLREQTVDATKPRPGRRVLRVLRDTLLVQIDRNVPSIGFVCQLVGAQIELVRAGSGGHITAEKAMFTRRQLNRQGIDELVYERVVELEDIVEADLHGVRPQQRAARRLGKLCGEAHLRSGAKQRTAQNGIDVRFARDLLQIRCVRAEFRCGEARSDHERAEARTARS